MRKIVTRRANLRLPRDCYADTHAAYSITIGVARRLPIFARNEIAASFIATLRSFAASTGVRVWAFCVMPDHVHVLMTPAPDYDVIDFIGDLKSKSLRAAWALGVEGSFWQPRFWDRVVRDQEGLMKAILYVLENPQEAGLVDDWRKYPWLGGEWLEVNGAVDEKGGVQAPALHSTGATIFP